MRLSVVVPATNPLTSSYQVFFSSVESWSRVADEVVIVDGGTRDDTYRVLKDRVDAFEVVSKPETAWSVGQPFHGLQFAVNLNEAVAKATGDWILLAHADYVVNRFDRRRLEEFLRDRIEEPVVRYCRYKVDIPMGTRSGDVRGAIINRRFWNTEDGLPRLRFGAQDFNGIVCDFPLRARDKSRYVHPETRAVVEVHRGEICAHRSVAPEDLLDVCVLDHFYYSPEQVLQQARLFDEYYVARQAGVATLRPRELRLAKRLHTINGFLSLEAVQACEHLPAVLRRDAAQWWHARPYGGARRHARSRRWNAVELKGHGLSRKIRTRLWRARGFQGVHARHEWVPVGAEHAPPLDVRETWGRQRFLSSNGAAR